MNFIPQDNAVLGKILQAGLGEFHHAKFINKIPLASPLP
jgi:hypothetical protein